MSDAGKWGDLAPRVTWGLIMIAVGAVALWAGGLVFATLGVVIAGLMMWELVLMLRPGQEQVARQLARGRGQHQDVGRGERDLAVSVRIEIVGVPQMIVAGCGK